MVRMFVVDDLNNASFAAEAFLFHNPAIELTAHFYLASSCHQPSMSWNSFS